MRRRETFQTVLRDWRQNKLSWLEALRDLVQLGANVDQAAWWLAKS